MKHIPILIIPYTEIDKISGAQIDVELPPNHGKIITCYNCGGLVFYQVVESIENTEHATDTGFYCAQCGQYQGGIINDPFEEYHPLSWY